jgi:outer membrane immunogenic protein
MRQLGLGIAAFASLITAQAFAADMAVKASPKAPTPAFSWTGCYLGAEGGVSWLRDKDSETVTATGAPSAFSPYPTNTGRPSGITAGGYVGCNYQFSGPLVVGIEANEDAAGISGGPAYYTVVAGQFDETHVRSEGSARGRLGYAFGSSLVYVTGGWAWADIREHDEIAAPTFTTDNASTRSGWTAGVGAEYEITEHVIGRLEYRYTGYSGTFSYNPVIFPGFTENHKISENAVRIGLSYKLN